MPETTLKPKKRKSAVEVKFSRSSLDERSHSDSSSDSDKSKLKCPPPMEMSLRFDEIKGQEHAKNELRTQYILPLFYPMMFQTPPAGILLYGPPGTGKTMLAKAATLELGEKVAFIAPSQGELRSKFEGGTEKNIEQLFKCARKLTIEEGGKYERVIIFIDEFDALAGTGRSEDPSLRRSVNILLQEMDGISEKNTNVSVIAATNYPSQIDGAIRRRMGAMIFIDLPDTEARAQMIISELGKLFKNLANAKASVISTIRRFSFCDEDQKIDDDFIDELVKLTGPRQSPRTKVTTEQLIENAKLGAYPERTDLAPGMFGMSGSDIKKFVQAAARIAADRATRGNFSPVAISQFILSNAPPQLGFGKGKSRAQPSQGLTGDYIYVSTGSREMNDFRTLRSGEVHRSSDIAESDHKKVYNYTITKDDFMLALKNRAVTVDSWDYLNYFGKGFV